MCLCFASRAAAMLVGAFMIVAYTRDLIRTVTR